MARLAHPLYGELRRATAGEMYLSSLRGKLARRLALETDDDMQATVRRAQLTLESDLEPDPELYLEAARHAMTLLDPDSADRFTAAAAEYGAAEAAPMRAMSMLLLGRGEQAEKILYQIGIDGREDSHHWATLRAANLIWMLGRASGPRRGGSMRRRGIWPMRNGRRKGPSGTEFGKPDRLPRHDRFGSLGDGTRSARSG
jgi:hypothetical protein